MKKIITSSLLLCSSFLSAQSLWHPQTNMFGHQYEARVNEYEGVTYVLSQTKTWAMAPDSVRYQVITEADWHVMQSQMIGQGAMPISGVYSLQNATQVFLADWRDDTYDLPVVVIMWGSRD